MPDEESAIYIDQIIGGNILSITDYAALRAGLYDLPPLYCPKCVEDGEYQSLLYDDPDPHNPRFVHAHVDRECYRNDKMLRDHLLIQQLMYQTFASSNQYDSVKIECTGLTRSSHDVRATLLEADLDGVVVEIQNRSGRFRNRTYRTVKIAHRHNHGIYIVLTPYANDRGWLEKRLQQGMSVDNPHAG